MGAPTRNTDYTPTPWYPHFPYIIVEALLLLFFLLEEAYVPSLSEASREAREG